jgi:hypothetical protein
MRADYHVHSEFSDDSWYPMESVVRDAIMLGLDEICFTDHVDYGVKPDVDHPELARIEDGEPVLNVDYARYFPRIAELAEAYREPDSREGRASSSASRPRPSRSSSGSSTRVPSTSSSSRSTRWETASSGTATSRRATPSARSTRPTTRSCSTW